MSTPPFLALPGVARRYRLRTRRGSFAVLDAVPPAGRRRGTALLVPGYTGSKEDFIALLAPLAAAGFRAVAVDQRGQYETGGPPVEAVYAQAELARDITALTRALSAEGGGPVHLLGHSLGGLIARAAVLAAAPAPAAPQAPWASLTILSSGPGAVHLAQAERTRMLLAALPVLGLEAIWQVMKELDQAADADPGGTTPNQEIAGFMHRRWLSNIPENLMVTGEQLLAEPDRTGELAAVDLPKLVLSGSVDEAWPVPLMDQMALRLEARRVVIPGAGHSPNAEQPEATATALAEFWGDSF